MKRDITRDTALWLQRGVEESTEWAWGPLAVRRTALAVGVGYSINLRFGKYGCLIAFDFLT